MSSNLDKIFQSFGESLSQESDRREELKKIVKDVEEISRLLVGAVQLIHNDLASGLATLNQRLAESLPTIRKCFQTLSTQIDQRDFSKYKFMWQNIARSVVTVNAVFVLFLNFLNIKY